jgi:hypothetical protein
MISFATTKSDVVLIGKIVARYLKSYPHEITSKLDLMMDMGACHCNGCPLRLADLLAADDFNFAHDVSGIHRHLDRATGKLVGGFLPRLAVFQ